MSDSELIERLREVATSIRDESAAQNANSERLVFETTHIAMLRVALRCEEAAAALTRLQARVEELEKGLGEMVRWFGCYPAFIPASKYDEAAAAAGEHARALLDAKP